MRALFITPGELSTGEAVTVRHMALDVTRHRGECAFLASPFTAGLLEDAFPGRVQSLTQSRAENHKAWTLALDGFTPDIIVFADYPLLGFSSGVVPLVDERELAALADQIVIATLDHLGYAQGPGRIFFGPAHLSMQSEWLPPVPDWMRILLPCPMNAPDAGYRKGMPFRYGPASWQRSAAERDATRSRYLDGARGRLVVHVMSNWAWQFGRQWDLPQRVFLPAFFEASFDAAGEPVVVVSVNHGDLVPHRAVGDVTVLSSGPLGPDAFQGLIDAADLLLTDNAVSATAGRRICLCEPVARLHNPRRLIEIVRNADSGAKQLAMALERERPGAVFPFEVFPIWDAATLQQLRLFEANPITLAMTPIDVFGGDASAAALCALLSDTEQRRALRDRQCAYIEQVRELPSPYDALNTILTNG